jgi:hypothetical protein
MFAPHLVVAEATRIRRMVEQLMVCGDRLLELGCGNVAAELCDAELQLARVHSELLEIVTQGGPRAPQLQIHQEELPF